LEINSFSISPPTRFRATRTSSQVIFSPVSSLGSVERGQAHKLKHFYQSLHFTSVFL